MNILAIGAHPDDIELGCFGTLALHHCKGDDIIGVILTKVESTDKYFIRKEESETAAKTIDMKLIFETFSEGKLICDSSLITFLDEVIKKNQIDVIYTHTIHDKHQDHRASAYACISAARNVKELYFYESPSANPHFAPQLFVDITNTFEKK